MLFVLLRFAFLQVLTVLRQIGGRSNVARKTLVDERFLI
jgi:Meckelin (Transmembrane protein 67)